MKIRCLFIVLLLSGICCVSASAQKTAIKTNLLYDAAANANLAIETRLAPKWTAELLGSFNLWKFSDNKQWRNYMLQPEVRYWFCESFAGHFVGAHLLGGQYNVGNVDLDFKMLGTDFSKLKDTRYQGWFVGAGIAYGYDWIISRHWNIEAEIGLGWTYTRYDRFRCTGCGKKIEENRPHNYFGPTKAAISIVYIF